MKRADEKAEQYAMVNKMKRVLERRRGRKNLKMKGRFAGSLQKKHEIGKVLKIVEENLADNSFNEAATSTSEQILPTRNQMMCKVAWKRIITKVTDVDGTEIVAEDTPEPSMVPLNVVREVAVYKLL